MLSADALVKLLGYRRIMGVDHSCFGNPAGYGRTIRDELERFLLNEAQPSVRLITADDLICCELQLSPAGTQQPQVIEVLNADDNSKTRGDMRKLREQLSERFSQWAYVDRSLRVFGEDAVQIFKSPRLMDWTRTQALNDADAIIPGNKLPGYSRAAPPGPSGCGGTGEEGRKRLSRTERAGGPSGRVMRLKAPPVASRA